MAQPKQAAKPFLRGGITDGKTLRTALSFFGGLAIMAFLNLVLTATFVSLGAAWLRILFCVSELLIYYCIGFYSGRHPEGLRISGHRPYRFQPGGLEVCRSRG